MGTGNSQSPTTASLAPKGIIKAPVGEIGEKKSLGLWKLHVHKKAHLKSPVLGKAAIA